MDSQRRELLTAEEEANSRLKEAALARQEQEVKVWCLEQHQGIWCPRTHSQRHYAVDYSEQPRCSECHETLANLPAILEKNRRGLVLLIGAESRCRKRSVAATKACRQPTLIDDWWAATDATERLS